MNVHRYRKLLLLGIIICLLLLNMPYPSKADSIPVYSLLLDKMISYSGEQLSVREKNNLLTITNASFVKLNGNETISMLDTIYQKLGCTIGSKNLLLLRSSPNHPLYLYFFNKEKRKAVYLEISPTLDPKSLSNLKQEEIFKKTKIFDLPWEEILKSPVGWEKRLRDSGIGFNEFKFLSITLLWTVGLPQEVTKAIEIHDHLCPGVLSGYYIAQLILSELPPQEDSGYSWVGSPVWCKEDFILSMLNTTPGKRNLSLFYLSDKSKEHLKDKNCAGIVFQTSRKTGKVKGLAVGFNWDKLRLDAGVSNDISKWEERLITAIYMLKHPNEYQKYAYVIKKFDLDKGHELSDYVEMGSNPWKNLGLWIEH